MKGFWNMSINLLFPILNEHYTVTIAENNPNYQERVIIKLDYPLVISHLNGVRYKVRYKTVEKKNDVFIGHATINTRNGNEYRITDLWSVKDNLVHLDRTFTSIKATPDTAIRITSEFQCGGGKSSSFDDYHFIVPGAFYNKNDTDGDGTDDYLGTFNQDYKDDRNPSLSLTCFSGTTNTFISLIRADIPQKDSTLTREQINLRHFVHDTDIGSLGFSPSLSRSNEVVLRCDYPFYERSSFCLNVDGSEWSAYMALTNGTEFKASYIIQVGTAENLTDASWQTTKLQMDRILDDTVELPFTLEESIKYRRELIFNSYKEYKDKQGYPAGFFMHFSPRKSYGDHNLLEYGFSGAQTLNCYVMLKAAKELASPEHRERATKTLDFFIRKCIDESGLPNGIYDVDKEKFVYWWTGVLFPFQYSSSREELEAYLGEQIIGALIGVADELKKVEGNYCRTMTEAMHYLLLCYVFEKENGNDHKEWLNAVIKFCDKMLELQNENGSWNRAYTMDGKPILNPPEWFGANQIEQGSGAIFPPEVLVTLYKCTKEQKYLNSAFRAAKYILNQYVSNTYYLGGLNDTTHKKSIKIDAVGAMFAMRSMLLVYEQTRDPELLVGARDAARILASWTYLWDIPFDSNTLLGKYGFKTTGWAGCDVIPGCSYVDNEFQEFVPDLIRIADYCKDEKLAILAKIVTRGMQHGLSMPQNMYGYSMAGVQCEGYMTSLWLSDTTYKEFSGAAAKNKGDDNDTCNGLINAQALYNLDFLLENFNTLDFDKIIHQVLE
jgi:hypothetical protein